jgi:biopolymer transport protein ExbD
MAASIATPSARGHRATAEVNVAPFIDVMLVLLIVFMVAAPMATIAVPLNLSKPDVPPPPIVLEPVFVSLQDTGTIYVGTRSSGEIPANWATLAQALREKTGGDPSRQILVRADQKVPYSARHALDGRTPSRRLQEQDHRHRRRGGLTQLGGGIPSCTNRSQAAIVTYQNVP